MYYIITISRIEKSTGINYLAYLCFDAFNGIYFDTVNDKNFIKTFLTIQDARDWWELHCHTMIRKINNSVSWDYFLETVQIQELHTIVKPYESLPIPEEDK